MLAESEFVAEVLVIHFGDKMNSSGVVIPCFDRGRTRDRLCDRSFVEQGIFPIVGIERSACSIKRRIVPSDSSI